MSKEVLQICKPHYINRSELSAAKFIKTSHDDDFVSKPSIQIKRTSRISYPHHEDIQKIDKFVSVNQFKQQLLRLLMSSKQNWQKDILVKHQNILNQQKQHRAKLEQIIKEILEIKKKVHLQFKHECINRKQRHCFTCSQENKVFKSLAAQYLRENYHEPKRKDKIKHLMKGEDILNNKQKNKQKKKIVKVENKEVPIGSTGAPIDIRQSRKRLSNINMSANSEQDRLSNNQIFRFNRTKQRTITIRRKNKQKHSHVTVDLRSSQQSFNDSERNIRKRKSTLMSIQNSQSFKSQDSFNDHMESTNRQNYEDLQNLNNNERKKRSYRKSAIQIAGSLSPDIQPMTSIGKSKFYNIDLEERINKLGESQISIGTSPRYRPDSNPSPKLSNRVDSPFSKQPTNFKVLKKRNSRGLNKQLNSSQNILIDFSGLQSAKQIKQQNVQNKHQEIQQFFKKKQFVKDGKGHKFSRYQRERLFYGFLKQELVKMGCLDDSEDEKRSKLDYLNRDTQKSINQRRSFLNKQEQQSYIVKERKQSLISKLNIFNQSVNFQDIKMKIEAALEQKDTFLADNQKNQRNSKMTKGMVERGKQKIVQKFLAQVLKITDLKRLLKKKFSKEIDWCPKMRQMHQFYTYLQYSLQSFRSNMIKINDNNYREISLEGKQAQIDLDNIKISQNIGNYEGLQNTQIAEYEHHRQIQCSMKYYGIDIKRLQKLSQFQYDEPFVKPESPSNVSQKSLRQIQQDTNQL